MHVSSFIHEIGKIFFISAHAIHKGNNLSFFFQQEEMIAIDGYTLLYLFEAGSL